MPGKAQLSDRSVVFLLAGITLLALGVTVICGVLGLWGSGSNFDIREPFLTFGLVWIALLYAMRPVTRIWRRCRTLVGRTRHGADQ
jgi:hypothetical protein